MPISRSPLAAGLRKVRAMPNDVGFWIVMGALLLAIGVFVYGWRRQRSLAERKSEAEISAPSDEPERALVPPFFSGTLTTDSSGVSGWWRVSTRIYNWYDLLLVAFIAGIYVLPLLLEPFSESQAAMEINFEVALGSIIMQFFMVALVIGFVVWRQNPVRWLGLRWPMWPMVFPIAIVGVLFTWGVLGILQMLGFIDWLQGLLGDESRQEVVKAFTETDDPWLLGTLVIMAVVVAPLTEEVMFRGYFYPVAKRFIGKWEAILFSSLVFAVIHNNAMALLPLFVLAVLLALAYEFTGSIWAPIGIHTLFNGATVGAQLAIKYGLIQDPGL